MDVPTERWMTVVICGHRTVNDTLGHDLVTGNEDRRYLVNESLRAVTRSYASPVAPERRGPVGRLESA